MNLKRVALWSLIASVVLSAIVGILTILGGTFGDFQIKVLLTTLTISGTSICAMSCGALWERGRAQIVALAGILLAIATAGFFIIGIWREPGIDYWKFSVSVMSLAIATAHVSLISLAKLAPRFVWSRIAAFVASYLLAILIIYFLWFEPDSKANEDTLMRIIGVVSIVLASLTILTPIFHRLSRNDLSAAATMTESFHATITCPACGASLTNSVDVISCDQCGCRFQVAILDQGRKGRPPEQS